MAQDIVGVYRLAVGGKPAIVEGAVVAELAGEIGSCIANQAQGLGLHVRRESYAFDPLRRLEVMDGAFGISRIAEAACCVEREPGLTLTEISGQGRQGTRALEIIADAVLVEGDTLGLLVLRNGSDAVQFLLQKGVVEIRVKGDSLTEVVPAHVGQMCGELVRLPRANVRDEVGLEPVPFRFAVRNNAFQLGARILPGAV